MNQSEPIAPPERYRRLALLDLMGLVGASGLGWAGFNFTQAQLGMGSGPPDSVEEWFALIWIQLLMLSWLVVGRGWWTSARGPRGSGTLTATNIVMASFFASTIQ